MPDAPTAAARPMSSGRSPMTQEAWRSRPIHRGGLSHPRGGLTVLARPRKRLHDAVPVMQAVVERVDVRAMPYEELDNVRVNLDYVIKSVVSACDLPAWFVTTTTGMPALLKLAIASAAPRINSTRSTEPT